MGTARLPSSPDVEGYSVRHPRGAVHLVLIPVPFTLVGDPNLVVLEQQAMVSLVLRALAQRQLARGIIVESLP